MEFKIQRYTTNCFFILVFLFLFSSIIGISCFYHDLVFAQNESKDTSLKKIELLNFSNLINNTVSNFNKIDNNWNNYNFTYTINSLHGAKIENISYNSKSNLLDRNCFSYSKLTNLCNQNVIFKRNLSLEDKKQLDDIFLDKRIFNLDFKQPSRDSSFECKLESCTRYTLIAKSNDFQNTLQWNSNSNNTYLTNVSKEIEMVSASALDILTDKQIYKNGGILNVTIKNNGNLSLFFPDTALGLKVINFSNNLLVYQWPGGRSITELQPNETKPFYWKINNKIISGDYAVTTTSIPFENSKSLHSIAYFKVE